MSTTATKPEAPTSIVRPGVSLGLIVAIACVAQFMVILDTTIVNVAPPEMKDALGLSTSSQQWVIDGYLITFGGFLLLASRASDLYGRKIMFQTGLIVFSAASLLGGIAGNGATLLTARIIQGLGAAALAPSTLTLITATHHDAVQRTKALTLWSVAGASGGGAGLVLGGVLTSGLNWRWVMFVNVPIGVAVLVAAVFTLVSTHPAAQRPRLDLPGAVTVTLGFGVLVYAISQAAEDGWGSAQVVINLIGAVALLVAFVVVETRTRQPLIPLTIFTHRIIATANAMFATVGAATTGVLFFLSLYLQQVIGESAIQTGLAMLPWSVAVTVATFTSRRLMARIGARALLLAAGIIAVGGLLWLSSLPTHSDYWLHVCLPTSVTAIRLGLTFLPLTVAATSGVAASDAGVVSGLFNVARQIGGALGLAIFVTIAASVTNHNQQLTHLGATVRGYNVALLVAAGLTLLMTFGAIFVKTAAHTPAPATDELSETIAVIESEA